MSFFRISTAMFFSFILEISSRTLGSNREKFSPTVLLSNRLMTPSLWMLALRRLLICSLISLRDKGLPPCPPMVIFIIIARTASKYAASWRSCSVVILEQRECAWRSRSASFANRSFKGLSSPCGFAPRMKFTPEEISLPLCNGVPSANPLISKPCIKSLQTWSFSLNFG